MKRLNKIAEIIRKAEIRMPNNNSIKDLYFRTVDAYYDNKLGWSEITYSSPWWIQTSIDEDEICVCVEYFPIDENGKETGEKWREEFSYDNETWVEKINEDEFMYDVKRACNILLDIDI